MQKKIVTYTTHMFLFLVALSFVECDNIESVRKEKHLEIVVESCMGKKLFVPDSLVKFAPFANYLADSLEIFHSDLKVYSHINASCPTCVKDIMLWDSLAFVLNKFQVPVILILESKDDFELIKYMIEIGEVQNFSYPFFLDYKKEFYRKNKFMAELPILKTVITDNDNNILLLGNPIHSMEIKDLYLKQIKIFKEQVIKGLPDG